MYSIHVSLSAYISRWMQRINPRYYPTSFLRSQFPIPPLFPSHWSSWLRIIHKASPSPVCFQIQGLPVCWDFSPSQTVTPVLERPRWRAFVPPAFPFFMPFQAAFGLSLSWAPGLGPGSWCLRSWFLTREETTSLPWTLCAYVHPELEPSYQKILSVGEMMLTTYLQREGSWCFPSLLAHQRPSLELGQRGVR